MGTRCGADLEKLNMFSNESDLVLWNVTGCGKVRALIEFRLSGAYEKQYMGLTSKTWYFVA